MVISEDIVVEEARVGAGCLARCLLFLLLFRCRRRHQLFVIDQGPLGLGPDRQNVRQVGEANEVTLVGRLLVHLNVYTLVEGTIPSQVVKVDITLVVADLIEAFPLSLQLLLDSLKLGTLY